MKNKTLNWWCKRAWIYFECSISFIMMFFLLLNWNIWGTDLKVIASIAILIPLHVIEEWIFPGGFHYQYNVGLFNSNKPNHYPMCRLSDMFTNTLATLLYIALTFICTTDNGNVPTGFLLGTAIFSMLELFMHTLMGIKMYIRFRKKGKTTIYGSGSITAYFGFVPLGIIAVYCISEKTIILTDWIICLGILLFIGVICILIPENTIKKKDSSYFFESEGYYKRFL